MSQQSISSPAIPSVSRLTIGQAVSRLTIEQALWILITIAALVLRVAKLDAALLSRYEAGEALAAWQAVSGQQMPAAGYSPLLFTVDALLFALFGASDAIARLLPALCGTVLVITPSLLRRHLGRLGALCAGIYLTLSPTLLVASRQLDGVVVGDLAGMVFLIGIVRFLGTENRSWLGLSAAGLALGVVSSPSSYGLLLALGVAGISVVWAWPDPGVRRIWARFAPHAGYMLAICLLTGFGLSTAMGWNPAGLGSVGNLLATWIARFGSAAELPTASPVKLLVVYDPLALIFGIGGLAWAMRRGRRLGTFLGVWAAVGILLLLLMPGRTPLDVSWVVLSLSLLLGLGIEALVQNLRDHGHWLNEGLHVPVVVFLWIHLYLMLSRYSVYADATDLALALLTVALPGLLALVFGLAMKLDAALRAVVVGTAIVLLGLTLSAGWGGAFIRQSDPRELLARAPTATEVRDLLQTLRDLSWRETGFPTTLSVLYEVPLDPVVAWYLRDFGAARAVERLRSEDIVATWEAGGAVLTADAGALTRLEALNSEYAGQDFVLRRRWSPSEVACVWEWPPRCQDAVGWLLLRKTLAPPVASQQVVLWVADGDGQDE
jgi:uncharacterized protein (TIGR03663 family)